MTQSFGIALAVQGLRAGAVAILAADVMIVVAFILWTKSKNYDLWWREQVDASSPVDGEATEEPPAS